MPLKEIRAKPPQMCRCTLTFADAMRPAGIGHETELPAMTDQFVDEHLRILIMYIVIRRAVDIQELSAQVPGMGDR